MSDPLYLPSKGWGSDHSQHDANARALETWAEQMAALMPHYLGRLITQGAAWTNAAADGWEDWGGGGAGTKLTVTKNHTDTNLLVRYGPSLFSSGGTASWNYAISDGTTRFDQLLAFQNVADAHIGFTGVALLTGLTTGAKTLKVQVDATSGTVMTDGNDYLWMEVWEVPA